MEEPHAQPGIVLNDPQVLVQVDGHGHGVAVGFEVGWRLGVLTGVAFGALAVAAVWMILEAE